MNLPASTINTSDVREASAIFRRVDIPTLRQLITSANAELEHKRGTQRAEALKQVVILAEEFNMTGKEIAALVGKRVKTPAGPHVIRFRHPSKPELTWSGNGKPPTWVKEWEAQYGSRDSLKVGELKEAA